MANNKMIKTKKKSKNKKNFKKQKITPPEQ